MILGDPKLKSPTTKMKTITIQGVPYSIDGQVAYIYGTTTAIGTYKADPPSITLNEGWKTYSNVIASLKEYRENLDTATKAALVKAAEIQKA